MIRKCISVAVVLLGVLAIVVAGTAQQSATEAPAGFDTPTLVQNPGSQSVSNGIAEPAGDTYANDQSVYEQSNDPSTGLGPLYNASACSDCHQNPVSGAAGQITELRVGHLDANGNFANPSVTVPGSPTPITGRSIINDRAIVADGQEHVPDTETIRTLRATLNTLGDGFVEAIDDATLQYIAANQPALDRHIHGEAISVPVFEAPGFTRIGRFGWKDQHGSLLSFAADAYLNEMGITNRLRPHDTVPLGTLGKITPDPEDTPDNLGLAAIDHFALFVRGTRVPPALAATSESQAGQAIFEQIGCATCHVQSIVTAPAGKSFANGTYIVPEALGNKRIHPYGDFLLHDIGTGDGIVQTATNPETANKLRTAPLWGLRVRPRYMHDLKSLTLESAIDRHRGEAEHVRDRFQDLSPDQKQALLTFLNSL